MFEFDISAVSSVHKYVLGNALDFQQSFEVVAFEELLSEILPVLWSYSCRHCISVNEAILSFCFLFYFQVFFVAHIHFHVGVFILYILYD